MDRRASRKIFVGDVPIGGGSPITIQSMCNTKTHDVDSTVAQILKLEEAGCDLIRVAVNSEEDAKSIQRIKEQIHIPIIADIQYDYKLALYSIENHVDCLRLNPGNIGDTWKIQEVVNACKDTNIPIRVGVNSGSIKQEFLNQYHGVNEDSICYSALEQCDILESCGFSNIKVSLKASDVNLSIASYKKFAEMTEYPLHLGITESGPIYEGTIKSSVGIGTLLAEGIGDTIRVSLTANPIEEVKVAKEILKSLSLRTDGINLISCPTCARTNIDLLNLVEDARERLTEIDANLTIALMGCPVNGPGEAREADYGITGGDGKGIIFKKGEVIQIVEEDQLLSTLIQMIQEEMK